MSIEDYLKSKITNCLDELTSEQLHIVYTEISKTIDQNNERKFNTVS